MMSDIQTGQTGPMGNHIINQSGQVGQVNQNVVGHQGVQGAVVGGPICPAGPMMNQGPMNPQQQGPPQNQGPNASSQPGLPTGINAAPMNASQGTEHLLLLSILVTCQKVS